MNAGTGLTAVVPKGRPWCEQPLVIQSADIRERRTPAVVDPDAGDLFGDDGDRETESDRPRVGDVFCASRFISFRQAWHCADQVFHAGSRTGKWVNHHLLRGRCRSPAVG